MAGIYPITRGEFLQYFQRCMPPGGWSNRIAVANSAGPDSTCLLYLIADLVAHEEGTRGLPKEVWSFHIDHNLQPANSLMAKQANQIAHSIGALSYSLHIPWGEKPFPLKPGDGEPLEKLARSARSNRLLHAMYHTDIRCIAYGHHGDDQVETSIMRLIQGSGDVGAAAMRPVRRWGMGQSGIDNAGARGMDRWVIRPLLDVPKSRILATCEVHKLEYVTDATNFQPSLTLRNTVRHYLSQSRRAERSQSTDPGEMVTYSTIESVIRRLCPDKEDWDLPDLREAVRKRGYQLTALESQATIAIQQCLLPSPPSTLLLSASRLAGIPDKEVRIAVVRRILRYASPRPWGSVSSVARGDPNKLARIAEYVWRDGPEKKQSGFSIASRVTWQPKVVRSDGRIRHARPLQNGDEWAWAVTRDPPWSAGRATNDTEPAAEEDWKYKIASALRRGEKTMHLLWDARFRIDIKLQQIPHEYAKLLSYQRLPGRILVSRESDWYLPRIIWERDGKPELILAKYHWENWEWSIHSLEMPLTTVPWVQVTPIRTLEAL